MLESLSLKGSGAAIADVRDARNSVKLRQQRLEILDLLLLTRIARLREHLPKSDDAMRIESRPDRAQFRKAANE